MKKYQIIYADPPWEYQDKLGGTSGAGSQYETQSIEWIANLPVSKITDKNCFLFLWVTGPQLRDCWLIFDGWGFTYKTIAFTWVKRNRKHGGFLNY